MQVSGEHSYGAEGTRAQSDLLLEQAQGAATSKEKAKIEKAGHDFEAILLGSWLQGAEKSFAAAPGGDSDDEEDGGGEQFMSMAMQQLAGTLASSGGIGIGRMIASHLQAASGGSAPAEEGAAGTR